MRVRRETGDYSIKFTETTNPVLPKNLTTEDLLGAVIEDDHGSMTIVTEVEPGEGVVTLTAGGGVAYTYTLATGVVEVVEEG